MEQVDWLRVVKRIRQKRALSVYSNIIERIFLAQINRLIREKKEIENNNNVEEEYIYIYKSPEELSVEGNNCNDRGQDDYKDNREGGSDKDFAVQAARVFRQAG